MPSKRYESIVAKAVLNRVKAERMPFDWSINPYRGCAHGCSFCYARSFQSFIGKDPDAFQHHIFMKTNAAEALTSQLERVARKHGVPPEQVGPIVGPVAIGTATDPYQPIEAQAAVTRECLKVLAKYRVPTSVTTRSPLILRDMDLLREMDITSLNISINTLDAELVRQLEPATPFPEKRLETVQALAAEGFAAGVFLAPILPFLTDSLETLDTLFAAAKKHGAAFAMTSLLRLAPDVKPWYFRTLEEHFPELVGRYARMYEKAYVDRTYGDTMKRRIDTISRKYGLTAHVPQRIAQPLPPPSGSGDGVEQLSFSF